MNSQQTECLKYVPKTKTKEESRETPIQEHHLLDRYVSDITACSKKEKDKRSKKKWPSIEIYMYINRNKYILNLND